MPRSTKHDVLFKAHARPGMTAEALLALLSCEGNLPYGPRLRAFRRLRTDVRLKYIRDYLKANA